MEDIRYISTRGEAPALGFDEVLLAGLARDGGLYVPDRVPALAPGDIAALAGLPYAEAAYRVVAPFVGKAVGEDALQRIFARAYEGFDHAAVAPLVQLGANDFLLELFHGPSLAFKDYPLQPVGLLFDHVLRQRGERATIVVATSGDTGSAAIEACRGREAIDIFVLHPKGRVSEVQRRQMTTVDAPNVHNIAIEGNFDDCQDIVKALFNDHSFRDAARLSAMNSINWARIVTQAAYYVIAAVALGAPRRPVAFAVPTGNFGNIFAGYVAQRMGLPVAQLVVGSNRNDIVTRFFETGEMSVEEVVPSLSPSMDIQVSSNFERLLFEMVGRDAAALRAKMAGFRQSGRIAVDEATLAEARKLFAAARRDDDETLATIARLHRDTGLLVDPHTAIGIAAGRACLRDPSVPMVALATAHPAKFPDAVERATGIRPALPPRLADLFDREEHADELPADPAAVKAHIARHVTLAGAA